MEVLIRWRCHCCQQPQENQCSVCNGTHYLERWVPYMILRDVMTLVNNAFVIRGRRKIPGFASDSGWPSLN